MSRVRRLNRMDLLTPVSKALITPDTVTATLTVNTLIMVHTTTQLLRTLHQRTHTS